MPHEPAAASKKDVEAALRYAEAAGWTVLEVHRPHR